jgi:hypothetical protein
MTNIRRLFLSGVFAGASASLAFGADVVPGTQAVAPAGGVTVQQGVTSGKPVPCADNTPRDAAGKCPDPQKTTSQPGAVNNSSTTAVPASSMK